MSFLLVALASTWLGAGALLAQITTQPVALDIPATKALVGQRLPFFIELRSKGPFGGAASFTVPEVPGVIIVKVGDPVVSSKQIGDAIWFVQTHEFAIFSQRDGSLRIPEFPVRFGSRDAISGPITEIEAKVPAMSLEIERPAGTDPQHFLVTAKNFAIEEQWNPVPSGEVKTGTVFKRTITQSADDITGMALAPAPARVPDGIRAYVGNPEVSDDTERGNFSGRRTETLTYLVERPGSYTLPALRYDWWNPESNTLESKTLPAVTFTAIAPPGSTLRATGNHWILFVVAVLSAAALAALCWHFREPARAACVRLWDRLNPPDRRAARALLGACRRSDASAASHAWAKWQTFHPAFPIDDALRDQLAALQRHLYGADAPRAAWNGASLAKAFRHRQHEPSVATGFSALPSLNP